MSQTMTGAGAILKIRVKNEIIPVQFCDSISISETTPLGTVKGVGAFYALEKVVLDWNGSGNLSFYNLPYMKALERMALDSRIAQNAEEWANKLMTRANTDGAILSILQRGLKPDGTFGLMPFCEVKYVTIGSVSFDISEGAISKIRYDFEYTEPYLYSK